MIKPICRSISIAFVLVCIALNGIAQTKDRKAAPSLSSDGVMTYSRINPAAVEWKRYMPEGFGLSIELPGEPYERPYPVPKELQSQILESKVIGYVEDGISIIVAHMVFSKRTDINWVAREMKRSLERSDNLENTKISLLPKGDRIMVRGSFTKFGIELDIRGFIIGDGEKTWVLSIQTRREKQDADVVCSRIIESVTIVR